MGRLVPLLLILLLAVTAARADAHSGGLDRCGGHHDRKRGGYHVHNLARFCGCYPEAESCRTRRGQLAPSPETKAPSPSQQPPDETGPPPRR